MGDVPWAAKDPIFWLHHCNIDRLWASWNRGGRKNPTDAAFLSQQFVFVDENGNRVAAKVADFLDTDKLGYTYESFETIPVCPVSQTGLESVTTRRLAVATGAIELGAEPASIKLAPAREGAPPRGQLESVKTPKHVYLVLRDLRAEAQPGVVYRILLDLPNGSAARGGSARQVGTVNFFGVAGHDSHGSPDKDNRFLSFDITALAAPLLKNGQLSAEPTVTISPLGRPLAEAKAVIGEVSLFGQ
jgi:tyrosinase